MFDIDTHNTNLFSQFSSGNTHGGLNGRTLQLWAKSLMRAPTTFLTRVYYSLMDDNVILPIDSSFNIWGSPFDRLPDVPRLLGLTQHLSHLEDSDGKQWCKKMDVLDVDAVGSNFPVQQKNNLQK